MVKRVHLGPHDDGTYGLFISKPGFDAKAAVGDQLVFDSRLGHYGSVIVSGFATSGTTIEFGTTLPYVPLAYVTAIEGSNIKGFDGFSRQKETSELPPAETGAFRGSQTVYNPSYRITKSNLQIIKPTWYANTTVQNYTVRYIVWRCSGL